MFSALMLYLSLLFHNLLESDKYLRWKIVSKTRPSDVWDDFVGSSRSRTSRIYCKTPHCGTVIHRVHSSIFIARQKAMSICHFLSYDSGCQATSVLLTLSIFSECRYYLIKLFLCMEQVKASKQIRHQQQSYTNRYGWLDKFNIVGNWALRKCSSEDASASNKTGCFFATRKKQLQECQKKKIRRQFTRQYTNFGWQNIPVNIKYCTFLKKSSKTTLCIAPNTSNICNQKQ